MLPRERHAPSSLGARLKSARDEAGLTITELADLLGVARATIREAERGRDPRASTLLRYLDNLPGLTPPRLLPAGAHRAPPNHPAAWSYLRDAMGFEVRRLTRRVTLSAGVMELTTCWAGVRSIRDDIDDTDPDACTDLVRAIFDDPGRALRDVRVEARHLRAGKLCVKDGSTTHELVFPRTLARRGLTYTRRIEARAPEDLSEVTRIAVLHAVRELRIEVIGASWKRALPRAWPSRLAPTAETEGFIDSIHAIDDELTIERTSRSCRLEVQRPLVGLSYSLIPASLDTHEPRPAGRRQPKTRRLLRSIARDARERGGLSARQLASRMGTSPMTVTELEAGRDARWSTLLGLLDALPHLSSWELLPPRCDRPLPARQHAWELQRDLFGCVIDEEIKSVHVQASGHSRVRLNTSGLHRTRTQPSELRLQVGLDRPLLSAYRGELQAMDCDDDEAASLRIRRIRSESGMLHQVVVPPSLARQGISFSRRLEHRGVYVMTMKRARQRTGHAGDFREGTTYTPWLPTRRFELVVRFPRGYWPEAFRAHVWAQTQVPRSDRADSSAFLHPEQLEPVVHERRREVSLAVERPLVGMKYALGWRLP